MIITRQQAWIQALEDALEGRSKGELWQYPSLLEAITYNGFLVEVHIDVQKPSFLKTCREIYNHYTNDTNEPREA